MTNVTYLLGAGASAEAIPVVDEFNEDLKAIKNLLSLYLKKNLSDEAYATLPIQLQENNSVLEGIVREFEWLLTEASNHKTIDTLAKKYYLTNSEDLSKLKRILILYFQIRQALVQPDKRYDSFLAALFNKINSNLSIADNIRILTWNYDLQIELSVKRYLNNSISSIKTLFQIFPNQSSIEHDVNEIFDHTKFGVVKINGNAFWSKLSTEKKSTPTVLDTYFGKYEATASIIGRALIEYNYLFYNSAEGDTFLKMFNFAWERDSDFTNKYSGYNGNLNIAERIASNTEILVVIGYSFPVFNRETDLRLFSSMINLKKVYIQDKNPDRIQSTMMNAFKIFQPPYHDRNLEKLFQLESNVTQFVIPYEI
ncbi:MAG: hypothetical protein HZB42_05625 [Sphingobacteriales bacterium]|nr:hypothetical protein [Sphingobacteriales bacterium]